MVPPLARPGRALPLAGLLLVALVPAPRALASATQITIMHDDKEIVAASGAHRDKDLAEMKAVGADVVKIRLDWRGAGPAAGRDLVGLERAGPRRVDLAAVQGRAA